MPDNQNLDAHAGRQSLGTQVKILRTSLLALALLSGCLSGQKSGDKVVDHDSPITNVDTAAGDTGDSATDSGDTATEPIDADADGYTADVDCDDTNAAVHPDAAELCNGIDDDCDTVIDEASTWYADGDGDGYGDPAVSIEACAQPDGYVANGDDCNDWNVEQNPSVTEYCNGADDNCDGVIPAEEIDADGDGFNGCTAAVDCDDTDPAISPAATEVCNSLDDDCDGRNDEGFVYYVGHYDGDGDGYGDPDSTPASGCPGTEPPGYVDNGDDCDDTDASVYPGNGC